MPNLELRRLRARRPKLNRPFSTSFKRCLKDDLFRRRQYRSAHVPEADARFSRRFTVTGQRYRVAVFKKAALFTGRKFQRLLSAPRQLDEASVTAPFGTRDGAGTKQ